MIDNFEDFKASVRIACINEEQLPCECGQGITVMLRTKDAAEKLTLALRHELDKAARRQFLDRTLAHARGTFYPVAAMCLTALIARNFTGEFELSVALTVVTIYWGLYLAVEGTCLMIRQKRADKKAIQDEIKALIS